MGKNTIRKGKQKEPAPAAPATSAVPPPPPPQPPPPPPTFPSPPSAHHIQPPQGIVDTIQEEEEFGGLPGGLEDGEEEETWQDVGHSADGWGPNVPGNSNHDSDDNDGWESNDAPPAPTPPPPPPKQAGGKGHAKSHHQQPQPQRQSSNAQKHRPMDAGRNQQAGASSWGYAKPQQPQGAWAAANDGWGDQDDGWGAQDDLENADDGWGEEDDGWNTASDGWAQQPHSVTWGHATSAHTAQSQAPSQAPTTGWQSWGEEARRLPKVTFDPAIPPSPSSTGSKTILSQMQRSQILNGLLNKSQQNQRPYPMPPTAGGSFAPVPANTWQHQPSQHGKRQQQQPQPQLRFPQPQPPQHHHPTYEQHHANDSKKNKKYTSQPQHLVGNNVRPQEAETHDIWGLGDGWSDSHDDEDQDDMVQDDWGRRVHFPPGSLRASMLPSSAPSIAPSAVVENFTVHALPQNKLGLSNIPMSKTLSYAYSGTTPSSGSEPGRAAMQHVSDFPFVESRGEALQAVQRAFYGKQRKASGRFHWLFPPEKDERVSSLLSWINSMSFGVASFGLQKFLQTRERGALIINADYRPVHSPNEPAFDWVTWNQIQPTLDRTLQESVGYYNPAMHIIVFVLLPSPSGNSVAIWRRKLPIPDNIRLAYQAQITQAIASLQKDYPVHVDELPEQIPDPPPQPPPKKKKRKWYKLWLST